LSQVLWSASTIDEFYFGRGSYWTNSETFARWFCAWRDRTYGVRHAVYRAEVQLQNEFHFPFGLFVPSKTIDGLVETFGRAGFVWISFYEGSKVGRARKGRRTQPVTVEGSLYLQYVYIGDDPIPAQRAQAVNAKGT
jgi:hypothetical protein